MMPAGKDWRDPSPDNRKKSELMPRAKKDAKILNIKLSTPISEKLDKFCEESGQSKTVAVERFLNKALDEYFARPEETRKLN